MFSAYDTASVVQEIQKVKKECDYLVVYVHWGIERNTQPEAYQREMGHQYIDAGADLVVGSHPHVLQGIELYHGKWILYSLGNFVFGSSIPETMLVQASVDAQGETALSIVPATSSAGYTRELDVEKKECDYLVVYVHWGIERNTQPEAYQREMGHQYIDAGADLVVGSHPHVLQGIELYHGKWILYSLGNFVFGSSIPETMLVQASVDAQGETALSIVPATSSAGYTRELDVEKKEAFYQKIQGLSDGVQIDENGKVQVQ